jgi:hypothetical protein
MTKKDLKKRIIELEDLVNHQKRLIDVLYIQLDEKLPFTYPPIPVQQGDCPAGGWHEYPNPWHSITAPFCIKCGQSAPNMGPTYTTSDNTNES